MHSVPLPITDTLSTVGQLLGTQGIDSFDDRSRPVKRELSTNIHDPLFIIIMRLTCWSSSPGDQLGTW